MFSICHQAIKEWCATWTLWELIQRLVLWVELHEDVDIKRTSCEIKLPSKVRDWFCHARCLFLVSQIFFLFFCCDHATYIWSCLLPCSWFHVHFFKIEYLVGCYCLECFMMKCLLLMPSLLLIASFHFIVTTWFLMYNSLMLHHKKIQDRFSVSPLCHYCLWQSYFYCLRNGYSQTTQTS